MSTKITADNGVELEVCHLGIDATNPNPTEPSSIWARLTPEQRAKLAAALSPPSTASRWTREDLPSPDDVRWERTAETWKWRPNPTTDHVLDAVVAHLNAHHPKPSRGVETGYALQVDALTRERDALDSQLTRVDMECAEAVTARVAAERTCDELRSLIEGQKEHVSKSIEVRDRMRRDRDEALRKKGEMVDRAVRAERERDAAVARAEALEAEAEEAFEQGATWQKARTTPAVTHADVEKALDTGIRGTTDGGLIDQDTSIPSGECVRLAVDAVCDLLGVEAEQAVDPVDEQTDALADILYGHEMVTDQMRGVLERVVRAGMLFPGLEASSDE